MSIEDDIALLQQGPLLGLLGGEALRILAIGSESRIVQRGALLFTAGEPADGAYVVEVGSFTLRTPGGRESIARRGAVLGEYALLIETPRAFSAVAREFSSVLRIPRPLFLKMLDGYPAVAERLRRWMLQQCEELADEISAVRAALAEGLPADRPKPN
ncbi:MAG TPA: Crp/Fnr family transcriptional regulator [Xanthobacteraceae bacterium]|nr:Crp/Fnr family transcriptional regulator [Xanthobacteraceae bacterium]